MLSIDLSNKLALVTGGGGALGKQIALDLADCGCDVCLAANHSVERAQEIAREISNKFARKAHVVHGDVRFSGEVTRMVDETIAYFGGVPDILVNNAGYYHGYGKVFEVSDEVIDRTIDTNLKGYYYMIREVSSHLIKAGQKGKIVNIASGAGHSGRVGHAHYCASKAGVILLTQASALDLAPQGINVNSISVGFVDVGAFDEGEYLKVKADIIPRILLKKPGKPSDISAMVCYLSSSFADWISGTDIRIDGGESAGRVPLTESW